MFPTKVEITKVGNQFVTKVEFVDVDGKPSKTDTQINDEIQTVTTYLVNVFSKK